MEPQAGEMTQWLRSLVALLEDTGSRPKHPHDDSQPWVIQDAVFWPLMALHAYDGQASMQTNHQTHKKKREKHCLWTSPFKSQSSLVQQPSAGTLEMVAGYRVSSSDFTVYGIASITQIRVGQLKNRRTETLFMSHAWKTTLSPHSLAIDHLSRANVSTELPKHVWSTACRISVEVNTLEY